MKSIFKTLLFWQQLFLVMTFCMFGFCSHAKTPNKYPCGKNDLQQIRMAILDYVAKNSTLTANEITIVSEQCASSYASAIVHPINPVVDDAVIYLHHVNKDWVVMSLGTSFDDKFLAPIPKVLRK